MLLWSHFWEVLCCLKVMWHKSGARHLKSVHYSLYICLFSAVHRLQGGISGAESVRHTDCDLRELLIVLMAVMQVGDLLLERIRALQQKHNIIGDVRGQGLMLGVEMVKDQASKEPAAAETAQVSAFC